MLRYLRQCHFRIPLFDVPLHFRLREASKNKDFDLRTIFNDTLVARRPDLAITFVDNHDTQPLQDLESSVEQWFKPLAYALILLREQGTPCVFYADLYGARYKEKNQQGVDQEVELPVLELLRRLLKARRHHATGPQQDYFDDPHIVGWTRQGDGHSASGCAVLLSNNGNGVKRMAMGIHHRNRVMIDAIRRVAAGCARIMSARLRRLRPRATADRGSEPGRNH